FASTFLLYSSASILLLLSFPTRRSSDLDLSIDIIAVLIFKTVLQLFETSELIFILTVAVVMFCEPFGNPVDFRLQFKKAGKRAQDRKSTRLNSSHVSISYDVFRVKKKKR